MTYGKTIGKKFYEDGRVRRYPGNTVVADVTPDCPAYDVMTHLYEMVQESGMDSHLILLPHDSYHMTVIRGLNDQVRVDTHWPARLPKDTPFTKVDDYVTEAVLSVPMPAGVRMKFDRVGFSATCMIIKLWPADEEQAAILKQFRDAVADNLGLRLPKHDEYRFHISLGYTRIIPEGEDAARMEKLINDINAYIADRPSFEITKPYMAYYNDMLAFSPVRLPRD
jgi:hypothetical protein